MVLTTLPPPTLIATTPAETEEEGAIVGTVIVDTAAVTVDMIVIEAMTEATIAAAAALHLVGDHGAGIDDPGAEIDDVEAVRLAGRHGVQGLEL